MMFNSPLELCPVCKAYVALDQTPSECAAEHCCNQAATCPLAKLFAAVASAAEREAALSSPPA